MEARDGCAAVFSERHFGQARLKNARRTKCLVRMAELVVKHPGGTLPARLAKKDLKAFYNLMNQEAVTHREVLATHREQTFGAMRAHAGVVLVIHDTTELDYSGLHSVTTLGAIGNGGGRGYLCHNSLAVAAGSKEVLGLANQILWKRPVTKQSRKRKPKGRRRESRLWKQGVQALPVAPDGCLWVDVADRGADLMEFLDYEDAAWRKYIVRSKSNRRIILENKGETLETLLHDWARSLPATDVRTQEVPAKEGKPARQARLTAAWQEVVVQPPQQARGEERGLPLRNWVVRVWEVDAPAGVEPLEWILLTNVPVRSVTEAWERVDWYSQRWTIEEYHKGMKTGCNIEDLQFTTEAALQPTIALLSVVTLWLLWLRQVHRRPDAKTRLAQEVFPVEHVRMLARWRFKEVRDNMSVHDFCLALGRLGGHQNRRSDGAPGWLVLWRGWTKLVLLLEGALTATPRRSGIT